jgi:arylsulfatase A
MDLPDDSYGPDVCTEFLADFIKSCAETDTPFLAYYPMILVHNPFLPTPNSKGRDETGDKKNFVDMVSYMDTLVGRLVDSLEANGLRDNTLIIFTADNGTNKTLVSYFNGQPLPGGKGFTRDHGTHVPLIANCPGHIPANQVNRDLVAFSDFFPTMVEATGLPPKEISDADGVSFWPQCLGERGDPREWIYGYYFPHPYAKRFNDSNNHPEVRYARDQRYKLYDNGDLYDTQIDVMETEAIDLERSVPAVKQARQKLQTALDSYPHQGAQIDHAKVRGVYQPK